MDELVGVPPAQRAGGAAAERHHPRRGDHQRPEPGLTLFTLIWLTAAAAVLLRLNFVALKEGWRARHLPRASDTGWTFGEVGIEATAAILILAFMLIPPLSTNDTSAALIPGATNPEGIHPFGSGSSK